ncbi:DUF4465 domain-containing protein [Cytophaga aurantiaca]|uniref:DUF4465 domain-containing protein n=1 Tax=Cytophaga aurantiaca TaxID=29530 RepID=UPI000361C635|nr:DUF4465 domain-containing protein [Cytophaga aurantiaca]
MKKLYTCLLLLVQSVYGFAQTTSTFEALPLDGNGYWIGADGSGGFTNGDAYFQTINEGWWSTGFAYSNKTDVTTEGYTNQYSVFTGSGVGRSEKFAIGKNGSVIELKNAAKTNDVTGFYVTNTTYAALDMINGSGFSKAFGGPTGNDPDYFQLAITGYRNNVVISDTVKIKLADYTFADNSKDYILNTWRWVDLRPLGVVDSLIFLLTSSDNDPVYGMNTPNYFAIDHFNEPLYDLAVVNGGTEAISKESTLFKSWATTCTVTRGYLDIANPGLGYASYGKDVNGTLKAGVNGLVSLGDNGVAILEFAKPIKNGAGPDFAVFENAFDLGTNQFLELAFVEVSSDGVNYVRFPSISKTDSKTQLDNNAQMDASLIYNLAGKYVANYGTPFDLEQLKNYSLLDVNNITHVKIIDVIGTIDLTLSSKDSLGNPINDPYATAFASCGFDLDAVGVINQNDLATSISKSNSSILEIYPNPSANQFNISLLDVSFVGQQLYVYDVNGILVENQIITETTILDATAWENGIYYIRVGNTAEKIIKID